MSQCYDVETPVMRPGQPSSLEPDLKCPYCGCKARKATGKELWPHRKTLWKKRLFICGPCDARVGCHDVKGHKWKPMGEMANAALRKLRMRAHGAFDWTWESGRMGRTEAYQWLADSMGIPKEAAHIGMFNEDQCRVVINICSAARSKLPQG